MHETELILSARSGDPAAWEALVNAHHEPVFRLAYLILGDPADADDIAQETFIRAHKHFGRYDSERPLRPWLFSIAANLARNRHRSMGRYTAAAKRLMGLQEITHHPEPVETTTEAQIESQRLWSAIRELSKDDQTIIYLRYFMELTTSETAQALKIAEGTVKSRLSRSLDRLKKVIDTVYPDLHGRFEDV